MKKLISLTAAFVLILSLLASCKSDPAVNTSTSASALTESEKSSSVSLNPSSEEPVTTSSDSSSVNSYNPVNNHPNLKDRSLFVLGDSISIDYGPYLGAAVNGVFKYSRKQNPQNPDEVPEALKDQNGRTSKLCFEYLKYEVDRGVKYDILMINCGIHDMSTGVSISEYEIYIDQLVKFAKANCNDFVWVTSTDFGNKADKVAQYNEVATRIMTANNIFIIDLNKISNAYGVIDDITRDSTHFKPEYAEKQGQEIARLLKAMYYAG